MESNQVANNNEQEPNVPLTLTDHLNKKLLESFKNALEAPGNSFPKSDPIDSVGNDETWQ